MEHSMDHLDLNYNLTQVKKGLSEILCDPHLLESCHLEPIDLINISTASKVVALELQSLKRERESADRHNSHTIKPYSEDIEGDENETHTNPDTNGDPN